MVGASYIKMRKKKTGGAGPAVPRKAKTENLEGETELTPFIRNVDNHRQTGGLGN